MVENMHDTPYQMAEQIGPEITATMTAVCAKLKSECGDLPVGVQVLAGANQQALAIAQAAGKKLIFKTFNPQKPISSESRTRVLPIFFVLP